MEEVHNLYSQHIDHAVESTRFISALASVDVVEVSKSSMNYFLYTSHHCSSTLFVVNR